jgi:2-methylcitrate dehydratase
MTAIALIFGTLTADHYEDACAADPRIDALRAKMLVREEPRYSADYLDPDKRSIANAVQISFTDGAHTARIEVEYPIGHRRRRAEGVPLLLEKFERNAATQFNDERTAKILALFRDRPRLKAMRVFEFMELLIARAR